MALKLVLTGFKQFFALRLELSYAKIGLAVSSVGVQSFLPAQIFSMSSYFRSITSTHYLIATCFVHILAKN